MLIDDFNDIIDYWIAGLNHYTFEQLSTKPSAESWSLGQLYMHLLENTDFYIDQIAICISNNDFLNEAAANHANEMFRNNEFPDQLIEGPPENAATPQPISKHQLQAALVSLKMKMNRTASLMAKSDFKGKTKHPGLNYFGAEDWLRFAEMHFRHHLRQKARIDIFLQQLTAND
ncbi:DinB family protein [Pinibacter aurantiacus]|uniref:DinB family protein n=1 Tax=Pinibacter aurantiacus TaxID=2851599 RepID=A0A9E2SC57_9BACT|nr:DinB family protein [Pinibacter aurantiacus]MBV4357190.1 DinB family protein [Pinibacter aurantiacus]